jgi:hypothetical protein
VPGPEGASGLEAWLRRAARRSDEGPCWAGTMVPRKEHLGLDY